MISPAAMFIESAVDGLKNPVEQGGMPKWLRDSQLQELSAAIGENTAEQMGVQFPISDDFKKGYELGLQAARVVLASSVQLSVGGIKAQDVL
jgi:hypothetical protein